MRSVARRLAALRSGPSKPTAAAIAVDSLRYRNPACAAAQVGPHGGPNTGGLHGGGGLHFAMGEPHGGGGPHGTPLRLGTQSHHGRRAPRGAPLHGGRQRQIRGSVPSHGAPVLAVRIHLPPAVSLPTSGSAGFSPEDTAMQGCPDGCKGTSASRQPSQPSTPSENRP